MERINLSVPTDLVNQLAKEDPWLDRGGKQAVILYYLRLGLKVQNKMNEIKEKLYEITDTNSTNNS